jgi:hypothetical protein
LSVLTKHQRLAPSSEHSSWAVSGTKPFKGAERSGLGERAGRRVFYCCSTDNAHINRTLTVLLEEAGGNPEELKKQVEVWFNNSMDVSPAGTGARLKLCY